MSEAVQKNNSNLYIKLINYARQASGKKNLSAQDEQNLSQTNDSGNGQENTFYAVKNVNIDLSDGLSYDELKALGVDITNVQVIKIIAQGWKADSDGTKQVGDRALIIEDIEIARFAEAAGILALATGFTIEQAWGKYFLDSNVKRFVQVNYFNQIASHIKIERDLLAQIKEAPDLFNGIKQVLGLDENNILIQNLKEYMNGKQVTGEAAKKLAIDYILMLVSASKCSAEFQTKVLGIKNPITKAFEGDLTADSLKSWAKSQNPQTSGSSSGCDSGEGVCMANDVDTVDIPLVPIGPQNTDKPTLKQVLAIPKADDGMIHLGENDFDSIKVLVDARPENVVVILVAGDCPGCKRHLEEGFYTDFAANNPDKTVILVQVKSIHKENMTQISANIYNLFGPPETPSVFIFKNGEIIKKDIYQNKLYVNTQTALKKANEYSVQGKYADALRELKKCAPDTQSGGPIGSAINVLEMIIKAEGMPESNNVQIGDKIKAYNAALVKLKQNNDYFVDELQINCPLLSKRVDELNAKLAPKEGVNEEQRNVDLAFAATKNGLYIGARALAIMTPEDIRTELTSKLIDLLDSIIAVQKLPEDSIVQVNSKISEYNGIIKDIKQNGWEENFPKIYEERDVLLAKKEQLSRPVQTAEVNAPAQVEPRLSNEATLPDGTKWMVAVNQGTIKFSLIEGEDIKTASDSSNYEPLSIPTQALREGATAVYYVAYKGKTYEFNCDKQGHIIKAASVSRARNPQSISQGELFDLDALSPDDRLSFLKNIKENNPEDVVVIVVSSECGHCVDGKRNMEFIEYAKQNPNKKVYIYTMQTNALWPSGEDMLISQLFNIKGYPTIISGLRNESRHFTIINNKLCLDDGHAIYFKDNNNGWSGISDYYTKGITDRETRNRVRENFVLTFQNKVETLTLTRAEVEAVIKAFRGLFDLFKGSDIYNVNTTLVQKKQIIEKLLNLAIENRDKGEEDLRSIFNSIKGTLTLRDLPQTDVVYKDATRLLKQLIAAERAQTGFNGRLRWKIASAEFKVDSENELVVISFKVTADGADPTAKSIAERISRRFRLKYRLPDSPQTTAVAQKEIADQANSGFSLVN